MTVLAAPISVEVCYKKHPAQPVSYTIIIHLSRGYVACYSTITGQAISPTLIIGRLWLRRIEAMFVVVEIRSVVTDIQSNSTMVVCT